MKSTALFIAGVAFVATTSFAGEGNVRRSEKRIPNRYIVVLESAGNVPEVADEVSKRGAGKVHHQYEHGLKALALETTEAEAQRLAKDPRVAYVEEDAEVTTSATWNLDRIDQRSLPLNGNFNPGNKAGRNVRVYVIDTGVSPHNEIGWRLVPGYTAISDSLGTTDCNGHGTHVAGLIAGYQYGVADGATVVPVRVMNCNGAGTLSSVLAGINWVIQDRQLQGRPSVANMSLTGLGSSALDAAVNSMINAGITTVVAAGNSSDDACRYSPARASRALTVGSTNSTDQRAPTSNYGVCVDLFAPGANVTSAWPTTMSSSHTLSGTSQAAPLVAGNAALWLERYPGYTPDQVANAILTQSTNGVVGSAGGGPNRLLYVVYDVFTFLLTPVTQLVNDIGFDNGTTFWTADICTVVEQTGCPPGAMDEVLVASMPSRSGHTHASLGGRPRDVQILSAPMTVPSNASTVELSFYLWVVTAEHKMTADDVLTVEVRDAAGSVLETVGTFSNLDESSTYVRRQVDMTRYAGKTIRISFTSSADHGAPTWFLLDDVELSAW